MKLKTTIKDINGDGELLICPSEERDSICILSGSMTINGIRRGLPIFISPKDAETVCQAIRDAAEFIALLSPDKPERD